MEYFRENCGLNITRLTEAKSRWVSEGVECIHFHGPSDVPSASSDGQPGSIIVIDGWPGGTRKYQSTQRLRSPHLPPTWEYLVAYSTNLQAHASWEPFLQHSL